MAVARGICLDYNTKKGGTVKFSPSAIAQGMGIPFSPPVLRVVPPVESKQSQHLRPGTLVDMVGQERLRVQLSTMLKSSLARGVPPEHVLLYGPPGLGKTSIAKIISTFVGRPLVETSAMVLSTVKLINIKLCELEPGDVLFIDEIHALGRKPAQQLFTALEDGEVDVVSGSGKHLGTQRVSISPFTLVGSTTEPGSILGPLLDRFGFKAELDFYSDEHLTEILTQAVAKLDAPAEITPEAAALLATKSRGTPRVALNLLKMVRDLVTSMLEPTEDDPHPLVEIDVDAVESMLDLFEIDELGLNPTDQKLLNNLVIVHAGGPVGIDSLAASTGEDRRSVRMTEKWLIRAGLMNRGVTGRIATEAAFDHLGVRCPADIKRGLRV